MTPTNINQSLTYSEIIDQLQKPEYKLLPVPTNIEYKPFEHLRYFGSYSHVWEDLKEELQRIPTPREYLRACLLIAQEFFTTDADQNGNLELTCQDLTGNTYTHVFNWNTQPIYYWVVQRQQRAYNAYLQEDLLTGYLMEHYSDTLAVGTSEYIDIVLGVDIVLYLKEIDYLAYIHVTSQQAETKLYNKEYRHQWNKKGRFRRDFSYHFTYTYNTKPDTLGGYIQVGDFVVPTVENLENYTERLLYHAQKQAEERPGAQSYLNQNSSLHRLEEWLQDGLFEDPEPKTIKDMWLTQPA